MTEAFDYLFCEAGPQLGILDLFFFLAEYYELCSRTEHEHELLWSSFIVCTAGSINGSGRMKGG